MKKKKTITAAATANGRKKKITKTNRGSFCAVLHTARIAPAIKVFPRHPVTLGQRACVRFVERVAGVSGVSGVWYIYISLSLCVYACVWSERRGGDGGGGGAGGHVQCLCCVGLVHKIREI